jgi:hypothetical protein
MLRWLAIAVLVACSHPAPRSGATLGTTHATPDAGTSGDGGAVGLEANLPELAKRSVTLYQELAKALADAAGDCAAATRSIDTLATTYADVTAANARVLHAGHDRVKQLKTALEPYDASLEQSAKQIADSPTMRACSQSKDFAKAMDRLVGEP